MGHHTHRSSPTSASDAVDVEWPFGKVEVADPDGLRETAYGVFLTSCRWSPGFCGRNWPPHQQSAALQDVGDGSPTATNALEVVGIGCSEIKAALGLKTSFERLPPSSQVDVNSNVKRPLTMAELMRQQMRVSEQSDNRLRKTLTRTFLGQMGRRAETIIVPLELLGQLKPSEFNNPTEYHLWQKQQLRIIESGILLHPSVPLDRSDHSAARLTEIIRSSETRPIDASKDSETMTTLCNCLVALAWRSTDCTASNSCHWADDFPINLHLYVLLLQSIFDISDETLVLDEVDELIELMKETWSTLGINKPLHNVCFTWVLFRQFVATGQVAHDLLSAVLTMLTEVANDAKGADQECSYIKVLSSTLRMILGWAEKRLCNYPESFHRERCQLIESLIPLASSTVKILQEDASTIARQEEVVDSTENMVASHIKSSMRNAFNKVLGSGTAKSTAMGEDKDASKAIIRLAKDTEDLAMKEKKYFSCIKKWHPTAAGVAAVTLHSCYGSVLNQYLGGVPVLTKDVILVLQSAGKLEKVLIQMVIEDCGELEEGSEAIIREMALYEVDSIIMRLRKAWINERLNVANECLDSAKETETWNPKSKTEPYAQSAVDMMQLVRETLDDYFDMPVKGTGDDLLQELFGRLETLLMDYISIIASCGKKQSYLPSLPPLTRCNQDSRVLKLWRRTGVCRESANSLNGNDPTDAHHPRPSTSRGTQRLFIRLNTLYYLLSYIHSLDKSLTLFPRSTVSPFTSSRPSQCLSTVPSYFTLVLSSVQSAIQQVAEVAAFRLVFLDSYSFFYENLYVDNITNARIRPTLRILKQNLTLLSSIVTERAQPMAVKEVMKASFEAFLMVLLAGGSSRAFTQSDAAMVEEDFGSLKRLFFTCGEGLVVEETIEKEAQVFQGVIALMGQTTEQLVLEFNTSVCGVGMTRRTKSARHKVPIPQSTRRWNRADPNTILRVLCHRNDSVANNFLKKTFRLPKRRQ